MKEIDGVIMQDGDWPNAFSGTNTQVWGTIARTRTDMKAVRLAFIFLTRFQNYNLRLRRLFLYKANKA